MIEIRRPLVALLETRMSRELARLVEKHGGQPWCVPAVRECSELSPEIVRAFTERLGRDRDGIVVFMTGVAVALVFEAAEQIGMRADLVAALRRVVTVCRGPKVAAALRGFGVTPTLNARAPFTSGELLDALNGMDLEGRQVYLLHYGERSDALAETLIARRAGLDELWLYRWLMPEPADGLARLVRRLISGRCDALAVTCQVQFRHLYQVAERLGRAPELVAALNDRVTVGAVGPACHAILQAYGVRVHVVPDEPKMAPLITVLMRQLELRAREGDSQIFPLHA
jgi:uroporphyrinogen-III synthase